LPLRFDPDIYIDPGFTIDKYIRAEGVNTLIEGSRGTGKTHILKMISIKLLDDFEFVSKCGYRTRYLRRRKSIVYTEYVEVATFYRGRKSWISIR